MDPTTGTAPQRSHEKRRYKEYLRNPEKPVPKTTAWRNKKRSSSYTSHPSNERPYKQRKLHNIDCTMPVPRQTRWYWQKMDCNKQDDNLEEQMSGAYSLGSTTAEFDDSLNRGSDTEGCFEVDDASNSGVDDDDCSQSDAASDIHDAVEQIRSPNTAVTENSESTDDKLEGIKPRIKIVCYTSLFKTFDVDTLSTDESDIIGCELSGDDDAKTDTDTNKGQGAFIML